MKPSGFYLFILLPVFFVKSTYCTEPERAMEGLYGGAGVGYAEFKIKGFAETFPPYYASRKRSNINIADDSPLVRLNLGYGRYWSNQFFSAAELGYQKLLGSEDYSITNSTIGHQVDIEYSSRADVSLLFGYNIKDNDLLYARFGFGVTNVYISPHDIGDTGGAFHDLYGPIYGLGYAHMLGDNFGLTVEFNHLAVHHTYNNDKNDGEIYDIKINQNQTQIGVFYHF